MQNDNKFETSPNFYPSNESNEIYPGYSNNMSQKPLPVFTQENEFSNEMQNLSNERDKSQNHKWQKIQRAGPANENNFNIGHPKLKKNISDNSENYLIPEDDYQMKTNENGLGPQITEGANPLASQGFGNQTPGLFTSSNVR